MLDELMAAYGNRFIFAAVGVCVAFVVLVIVLWLMRNRASSPFVRGGRNRQPRLQVLDAAAVDARRRLVLIRRDNIEHLIMIGGPTDIVIESGIGEPKAYLAGELSQPLAVPSPAPTLGVLEQRMPQVAPETMPQALAEAVAQPAEPAPVARRPLAPAPVQPPVERPAPDSVRAADRPMAPAQPSPRRLATPSAEPPALAPRTAAAASPAAVPPPATPAPPAPAAPSAALAPAPAVTSVAVPVPAAVAAPVVATPAVRDVVMPVQTPQPVAEEPVVVEPPARISVEPPVRVEASAAAPVLYDTARAPQPSSLTQPFPASRFTSPPARPEPPARTEPEMDQPDTIQASGNLPIGDAADILDAARSRVLQPQPEPFSASRFQEQSASFEPDAAPTVTPAQVRTPEFSEFERVLEEEMASHMAADPRLAKSLSGLGPVPVYAPADAKPTPVAGAGEEQNIQKEIARIFGEMSASRNG